MGYYRAGFAMTGVDLRAQRRYPFRCVQAEALAYVAAHGQEYDVIVASPPCQAYSALKHLARPGHPDLVDATRAALQAAGKPYVIENVVGAPLRWPLLLCGSMFGLETACGAQLRRHRLFESNVLLLAPGACAHRQRTLDVHGHALRDEATRLAERRTIMVVGATPRDPAGERRKYHTITVTGSTPQQNVERNHIRETFSVDAARTAMGIDWMTMRELSQAIPPVYTEWIGRQIRQYLA
jgi:DNA (cytosine-5)-methyltransferase 1